MLLLTKHAAHQPAPPAWAAATTAGIGAHTFDWRKPVFSGAIKVITGTLKYMTNSW
jgi:hypothetical protein